MLRNMLSKSHVPDPFECVFHVGPSEREEVTTSNEAPSTCGGRVREFEALHILSLFVGVLLTCCS